MGYRFATAKRTARATPRWVKRKPSNRRRSYAKKRTYRKRPMTKKRILNVTSRKKRNGMLSWSNTASSTGASQTLAVGGAVVAGNSTGFFLFSPTCMNLNQGSTNPNYAINVAERTATTCYMRGFQETLRIQTNSHVPWFHRRICFNFRGSGPFTTSNPGDTPTQTVTPYIDTSNGMERLWLNQQVNAMGQSIQALWAILFKGALNQDWNDIVIAPIDTTRVDLKYDKTWLIKSGNESGTIVSRKVWHPMNKNVVFDDDETGESMNSNYFSVDSKQGMGDYYIYDIIVPGLGGSATDLISVQSNATLYWHEK
ncbi:capsid protein [Peromfec virus RodF8_88]|uniref:Capsid protein n=1 Tax=Peromfec virus RodF8_88 TaxID=2929278 RepID=A0A976R5G4_9VIRU|nr:capsid protein [Peromfec virus RodF8_88]